MGMFDSLKSIVGSGAPGVDLDAAPADGDAETAVVELISSARSTLTLKLREGSRPAYLEAVLSSAEVDRCTDLLATSLGEPAKPFGSRPSFDPGVRAMVDSRGGIDKNQCLFLRRHADGAVAFAALWPWSNGRDLTLKIGVYDAAVTPPRSA